ncbi:MAG: RHS repeat-associated core domain-containing protein [Bryobacteraceae bacterium]
MYFAGGLISAEGNAAAVDALGTVRWNSSLGASGYYPYGVEYTATANDTEKYATYTRDSLTGLDYAMSRYYYSAWGRFFSPDPYGGSARVRDPGSWNRYMYGAGDPVNNVDPTGLYGWGGGGGGGGGWGPGMGSNPYGGGGVFGGPFGCLPPVLSPDEWYDAGGDTPVWFGPSPWEFGCGESVDSASGAGGGGHRGPLSNAVMLAEWYNGLQVADKALSNPNCAGLFGLTGLVGNPSPDALTVLSQISNSYKFDSIADQSNPNGTVTVTSAITAGVGSQTLPLPQGATITVSQSVQITVNNTNGDFVTGGPNAWAATILHELGHAYWDLYGIGTSKIIPDGTNPARSQKNQALIEKDCKL